MSRPESWGGTWIMKTALRGSRTWLASASRRASSTSSGSSRGVLHGVMFDQPDASSWRSPGMSTTRPSTFWANAPSRFRIGSMREVVVVPRDQVERDGAVAQPLVGQVHPRADALVHQLVQQLVASLRVGRQPLGLLGRRDERVEADVGDVALENGQLVVASRPPAHAEELGLVPRAVPHDRDDRLAREVAGHQRDVRLVDVQLDRVQELPPRLLGGVEVAREVDPHRASPAGSRRTACSCRRPRPATASASRSR